VDFYDALEMAFEPQPLEVLPSNLVKCLRAITRASVITTTLDPSAEQALSPIPGILEKVVDLSSPEFWSTRIAQFLPPGKYLLKIRGSAPNRERCLLTDEEAWFDFRWTDLSSFPLRSLVRSLLFIGETRTSFHALRALAAPGVESFVVFFQREPNREELARELSRTNTRAIWLPNDSDAIERLLEYLANEVDLRQTPPEAMPAPPDHPIAVPPLASTTVTVPPELIQHCAIGECALIAGSGLAAAANLPTWRQVVSNMLQWATDRKVISPEYAAAQREAVADDPNIVADNLVNAFQQDRNALIDFGRNQFPADTPPSPTHKLLTQIPFVVAATTNLDSLLEKAYTGTGMEQVYTPEDSEALLGMLSLHKPFLLKLYGTLERPNTVIFSPAEYKAMVARHVPFTRFMEGLFFSRTLLFMGSSLEGLNDFLNSFPFRTENPRKHYALVGVVGSGWKAKAEALSRRYNIHVIAFDASTGFGQVHRFIEELAAGVAHLKSDIAGAPAPPITASRLTRVELRNIGPFEKLELPLNASWLVLLGDNGVGKSSILKAIAVAIAGGDASAVAGRLVRAGQTLGEVRLFTDKNPSGYLTEIYTTTGSQAQVASKPARPLEAEGWIVFGFPPLRTGSWQRSGERPPRKPRPTPDDVLPLATGEVDLRMDKLKQWLIGLDVQIKEDRSNKIVDGRSERVRKKFFEIVGELTEGMTVEFDEVTPDNEVRVNTKDGSVPIEVLSQGMTSLYSWVGILLQRLFEIHEDSDDPTKHHAIVLMDEVDAHMHPKWQQSIVVRLKAIFPGLQMIVSTHSPLIVAGMETAEVARFARNKTGAVVQVPIDQDMLLGRTDQVLTAPAFDLPTALDHKSKQCLVEYRALLAKADHTDDDKKKLSALEALVETNVPPVDERLLERRMQNLLDMILTPEFIDKLDSESRRALVSKVKPVADLLTGEIDAQEQSA
jgi:energy-coupling factor transporter ATP-binding protein EcfA2